MEWNETERSGHDGLFEREWDEERDEFHEDDENAFVPRRS